jgi:hypothetical protein
MTPEIKKALKLVQEALESMQIVDFSVENLVGWNKAIAACRKALAAPPVQEPVGLRDALTKALTSTYVCGRVWEAWNVGTMTENDFQPAAECDELLDELVHAVTTIPPAASQPAVQEPFVWEVTEGGAYRSGEYWVAERIDDKGWNAHKKGGDALFLGGSLEFCKSVCERDAAAPVQESDCVLVPRDLVGAACAAIEGKRDAPKTLEQLRRYTTGDLSTPPAAPVKIGTIGHIDNGKATLTASILSALQATKPAAQPAVPLTDEQINAIWNARDLPEHQSKLSAFGMDRIRAIIKAALNTPTAQPAVQDADGENKAVRSFLMLYGQPGLTVGKMKKHMTMSGFKAWPAWVETEPHGAHLTKAGAQLWIRHLFALEATPHAQPSPVQEPVWFSLDEVKPTEGQMVLAWYKGFAYPDTAVWLGTKGWAMDSELASPYWDEVQNPITHWMPLPQGPLDLNADPTHNGRSA